MRIATLHAALRLLLAGALAFPCLAKDLSPSEAQLLRDHVVASNPDGLAIDPVTDTRFGLSYEENTNQFALQVGEILRKAEELSRGRCTNDSKPVVRLLIHVHGGLNTTKAMTRRVIALTPSIINDVTDWYYPVFVRWPSDFGSTYKEHILTIRQGNKAGPLWGTVSAPTLFLSDNLMSIAHYPVDLFYQQVNAKDRVATRFNAFSWGLSRTWKTAQTNSSEATNYHLIYNTNGFTKSTLEAWTDPALDVVQIPFRLTIGSLGQGALAQASWKNMKRRTSNMVHPAEVFGDYANAHVYQEGCVGEFFRLVAERANKSTGYNYQILLVGHSMGAIVLNQVLTEYRDQWVKTNILSDIVYMAAADSIKNTVNAINPLLKAYNPQPGTTDLRFFNLTLNRVAEISEKSAKGFTPHGSLLEWIDQHLEDPDTPADRTMGSEVNLLCALYLFDPVKEYCTFKAFDRAPGSIPATHGDFNLCPFWRKSFRELPPKGQPNYVSAHWLDTDWTRQKPATP